MKIKKDSAINLTLVIWIIFIIYLFLSRRLILYIEKHYIFLTLLGLFILILMFVLRLKRRALASPINPPDILLLSLLLFPVLLGMLVRPTGLSSLAAVKRGVNLKLEDRKMIILETLKQKVEKDGQYRKLNIKQILAISQKEPESIRDSLVTTEGIVYKEAEDSTSFILIRFLITCCAAHATPLGIRIESEKAGELKQDSWVKVYGKVKLKGEKPVIIAENINSLPKPRDSYLYY